MATKYIKIFFVLAVEGFYDIMAYSVKIWIINRVSVYVGCILYILYAIFFYETGLFDDKIVLALYFVRSFAFICEEFVDYFMDLELAVDLQNEVVTPITYIYCNCIGCHDFCCNDNGYYVGCCNDNGNNNNNNNTLAKVPIDTEKYEYKGSICVWTWYSVFDYTKTLEGMNNNNNNIVMMNVIVIVVAL